jgi:hypothetical protein
LLAVHPLPTRCPPQIENGAIAADARAEDNRWIGNLKVTQQAYQLFRQQFAKRQWRHVAIIKQKAAQSERPFVLRRGT